ncbi:hypothetical protein [Methylocaldum sp.]|uniref:hypothetical protein n=1 Tax=Methylocaldum sp. TaxID=1969727 RepID=UPI002D29A5BC|nr:hypothetical protein [Methylocaldum sp.]HYE38252.1 hypothetical protein [Methylocaldum sp.]
MSDYRFCRTCDTYRWRGHTCYPMYECRASDAMGGDDDRWTPVNAYDEEAAAARFVEEYDEGGDYPYLSAGSGEVLVRRGDERWSVFIEAESRPHYSARSMPQPITQEDSA